MLTLGLLRALVIDALELVSLLRLTLLKLELLAMIGPIGRLEQRGIPIRMALSRESAVSPILLYWIASKLHAAANSGSSSVALRS